MSRRAEKDQLPKTKNGGKGVSRFGPEMRKWSILIVLSILISILLFPNILARPKIYNEGDVADRDIKALREFLVKDLDLMAKNKEKAVEAVPYIYDFEPTATGIASRINEAFRLGRDFSAKQASVSETQEEIESKADELKADKQPAGEHSTGEKKADKPPAEGLVEEKPATDEPIDIDTLKGVFFQILEVPADDKAINTLLKSGFPAEIEKAAIQLITQVLQRGIVSNKMMLMGQSEKGIVLHNILTEKETEINELDRFFDLVSAKAFIADQSESLNKSTGSAEFSGVVQYLAENLIKPNLTFNKRETELRKDVARNSVSESFFKVKKDEMIVREGERIRPEHLLKIAEQNRLLKQKEVFARAPAMALLIGSLLMAVYLVGTLNGRDTKVTFKDLLFFSLTLLVTFLVAIAANFIASATARGFSFFSTMALVFAIPVASGAMVISVFHGMGVAVGFSLIISVLIALLLGGRVEFLVYFFVNSLVAAYGVKDCRDRSVFIKTGVKVGVVSMVLAISIEALQGNFYSPETLIDPETLVAVASAFIGGLFVGVIATGILPIIEMTFDYSSDIRLLELANLDQPILRDLMVQAPGTYHHSVIVSNMVEATAEAVNANPLLCKVAAYYHDIGKMRKPLYFIENQLDEENKHEKLAPSMSSLILISHVKDGVEMAKTHKLGHEIRDIIRQHHGTSVITFFYEKAKEQAVKKTGKAHGVKREDFRYPGPKPQTKEAGLVMLADVVEAASRTLVDPTAARIQGTVQKMINKVFSDGQLDECELTLKDLHEIAKGFNKSLSGIFHYRVEYPESVSKEGHAKKGTNGSTDQRSEGDSRARKSEDREESEESLRRLGMQ